ncbi:MAG: phosphoribosylformylglycinamidine synthase subunit PurS [Chloroflexia bacterium]
MAKWLAEVRVTLKPVVNDPPGLAIRDALHNLGYAGVESVRSGKHLQVYLEAGSDAEARELADDMCRRLLANPVIEDYTFEVRPVEEDRSG